LRGKMDGETRRTIETSKLHASRAGNHECNQKKGIIKGNQLLMRQKWTKEELRAYSQNSGTAEKS